MCCGMRPCLLVWKLRKRRELKKLADMYKSPDNRHDSGIVGGNQWTIGSLKDACDNRNCYCEILHDRA